MKHVFIALILLVHGVGFRAFGQDAYIFMTLHNLGCRQANHTYTGYLPNYGFAEGDLVQVILAGPNGHIDPPLANGLPGGDDELAVNPGLPFAMNPVSFTNVPNTFYSPEAILIQSPGNSAEPALHVGSRFYVRGWNGPSPAASTIYYNSATLTQDYPIGLESCGVDSAVRTVHIPFSFPALITYAVTFDNGHTFSMPPQPPQVEFFVDSTDTRLMWQPVPSATSYRIESSSDNIVWDSVATTSDTSFVTTVEQGQLVLRLFRVFAIR